MPNKKFIIAVTVFLLLLLGGAVYLVVHVSSNEQASRDQAIEKVDSGVATCQAIADSTTPAHVDEEWQKNRLMVFSQSQYPDLRTAGINFTNAAYVMVTQMTKVKDVDELNKLNSNLERTHAELRTACASHGVQLQPLSS